MRALKEIVVSSLVLAACQGGRSDSRPMSVGAVSPAPQMFSGFISSILPAKGTCFAPKSVLTEAGTLTAGLPTFEDARFDVAQLGSVFSTEPQSQSEWTVSQPLLPLSAKLVARDYRLDFENGTSDLNKTLATTSLEGTLFHSRVMLTRSKLGVDRSVADENFEVTAFGKQVKDASLALYAAEPDKEKASTLVANYIVANCGNSYVYQILGGTVTDFVIHGVFTNVQDAKRLKDAITFNRDIAMEAYNEPNQVKFVATLWASGLSDDVARTISPELTRIEGTQHGFKLECGSKVSDYQDCYARLRSIGDAIKFESMPRAPIHFVADRYMPPVFTNFVGPDFGDDGVRIAGLIMSTWRLYNARFVQDYDSFAHTTGAVYRDLRTWAAKDASVDATVASVKETLETKAKEFSELISTCRSAPLACAAQ